MRINFLVNQVFDGWEPTDTRLGGTEESVVRWAEELVKRGRKATVYRNGKLLGMHNGVLYAYREQYPQLSANGHGKPVPDSVTINIKSPDIPPFGDTLYLTNETNASELDLSAYDGVIWPSQWCVDNIPVNNPKTFVLPHGYDDKQIYPGKKVAKQCFYASSPDRGLDTLLEAWPKVYEQHPDATLILTYGAKVEPLPGVINLGEVDEDTMNEIYRTSEFWLHPASGGELFCITGIKAQAAHCWPVYIPTMALSETVKYGTKSTEDTFADDVIVELGTPHDFPDIHYDNWSDSTDRLLEIIKIRYNKA